jgi:20S proteasome alpha/beta subunit
MYLLCGRLAIFVSWQQSLFIKNSIVVEAISHAGTAIGALGSDGIVIAAEKKVTSKLLEQSSTSEKIYVLNE